MRGGLEHERREKARTTRKHFAPFVAFRVFCDSNQPASCMAVASRNWKASWTSGGWVSRRDAKDRG
jgi:hypothetical protein